MASINPISFIQGENGKIKVGPCGEDLGVLNVLTQVRAMASKPAIVGAAVTAIATVMKVDEGTAGLLASGELKSVDPSTGAVLAGIRAKNARTGEYVLITAISGINATITRAQTLPDGTAGPAAAAMNPNDKIYIIPMDNLPVIGTLDTADLTNQTALITLDPAHTRIPATVYDFQITMQDAASTPTNVRVFDSHKESTDPRVLPQLKIVNDQDSFGA